MVSKLFWKPQKVSTPILVAIAVFAAVAYVLLFGGFFSHLSKNDPRLQASQTTAKAFEVLRTAHTKVIDPKTDPTRSGLIGVKESPVTSKWGKLEAKQTTINPNWGAVFVDLYQESGLKAGDTIVMGISGSFPALNAAAIIAAETLQLQPLIVSSVMSSQWGANDPEFTWLDMEKVLFDAGVIKSRSAAASIGGRQDKGAGMPETTITLVHDIIKRNGVMAIETQEVDEAVKSRLEWMKNAAGSRKLRAYVNIGGGQASLGGKQARKLFQPGVNKTLDQDLLAEMDVPVGVAQAILQDGGIFINMTAIKEMAKRYGLPWQPKVTPKPGEGGVFGEQSPRLHASIILIVLFGLLFFARYRLQIVTRKHARQGAVAGAPVLDAQCANPPRALSSTLFKLPQDPG